MKQRTTKKTDPTPPEEIDEDETLAAQIYKERDERQEANEEKQDVKTGDITTSISQNKMLGLPEEYTVGSETFTFVPIPNAEMSKARSLCLRWPEPFLYAALAEPAGENGGIDYETVAEMMNQSREAVGDRPLDVASVRRMFRTLFVIQLADMLPGMLQVVLMVSPNGTLIEQIAAKVDRLLPSQLPDLLRAVMDSFGGFPGDEADHFGTP